MSGLDDRTSYMNNLRRKLHPAIRSKNLSMVSTILRQAAREVFLSGDKEFALKLIEPCFNYIEPTSNQYRLIFADWHYYCTGKKLSPEEITEEHLHLLKKTNLNESMNVF